MGLALVDEWLYVVSCMPSYAVQNPALCLCDVPFEVKLSIDYSRPLASVSLHAVLLAQSQHRPDSKLCCSHFH